MRYLTRSIALIGLLLLTACGAAETGGGAAAPTQGAVAQSTTAPAATAAPAQATQAAPTAAPAQPAEPTAAPAERQPTEAGQTSASPQGDVVITYRKSGGLKGINDVLTVYSDGTIVVNDKQGATKTGKVAATDLSSLQSLLAGSEFAGLESRYEARGNDLFTYELTVPSGGKGRTIVTMDGAKTPPVLSQVLAELEKLRSQVQ
jgi:hypothetical protein